MTDEEKGQLGAILEIVQSMQSNIVDLREDVEFIKDVMATKEDLDQVRSEMATKEDLDQVRSEMATKEDLDHVKSEVFEHIDGFAQHNQKFDHELIAAQAKFNRVEERVEILELKAGIGA